MINIMPPRQQSSTDIKGLDLKKSWSSELDTFTQHNLKHTRREASE